MFKSVGEITNFFEINKENSGNKSPLLEVFSRFLALLAVPDQF